MSNIDAKVPKSFVSSADIEGSAVYDEDGHKLGKIDHLVIDKTSGHVHKVVLVTKGFLGLGHSHLELPWETLRYSRMLNAYVAAGAAIDK